MWLSLVLNEIMQLNHIVQHTAQSQYLVNGSCRSYYSNNMGNMI